MFDQDFRINLRRTITAVEEWQEDSGRTPLMCSRGHRVVPEIHQNVGVILTCRKCRDYVGDVPPGVLAAYRQRRAGYHGSQRVEGLPPTYPDGTMGPCGGSEPNPRSLDNKTLGQAHIDHIRGIVEDMRRNLMAIMARPLPKLPSKPVAERLTPVRSKILDDLPRDYNRPQIHDVDPKTMDLRVYGMVDNVIYDPRLTPVLETD